MIIISTMSQKKIGNCHRIVILMFKLEIKVSIDFAKIRVYILYKMDGSLTLFHITQLKFWSLYTIKSILLHIYLKFG